MLRRHFCGSAAALAVTPFSALAQSSGTSGSSSSSPPFPRLGGWLIGGPFDNYGNATYQASIAKLSVAVLTFYPGLTPGGRSMNSVIQAIKAINPNTLVFLYVKDNEMDPTDEAYSAFVSKISGMNWWLYPQGTSGSPVTDPYGNVINNTLFTAKDSSGLNSVDWMSQWFVSNIYSPNPAADGLYMDNVNWEPRVDGDWSLSGATTSSTSAQAGTWLRQGYARYVQNMRQQMAGKLQIGNVADWGMPQAVLTELQGAFDGGAIESIIGQSYSIESYGGWQAMLTWYRKTMAALGGPKLGIFGQDGSPTDFQGMRYGLTSCLMDNGYFWYNSNGTSNSVAWFDEFDANLGQAVTPPPTAAWQQGVWRRDFQNGIALVNPKGNGAQTVTLEAAFIKIKGTQVPAINDGSTVTKVTLADRDGILLLRNSPVRKPKPPTDVTVQL